MVQYAALLDSNYVIFAQYVKADCRQPNDIKNKNHDFAYFDRNGLHLSKDIRQENFSFGQLIMNVSTEDINRKFQINLLVFLTVFFIIIVVSYFVALRLQRIISSPIIELINLSERITAKSDYTIRIPHTIQNEIGLLQISFDTMVQQLNCNIVSLRTEIEDRIRSQNETQLLRSYLQNIIDSISSFIIAADSDGLIKQVNLATAQFFNTTPQNFINLAVTSAVPMLKGTEKYFSSCLVDKKPCNFSVTYTQQNNPETLHFNVTAFPLLQTENSGIVLVIHDVTEKNRIESMMIQSEKMASLGGLAAGMAHEINNPLGIISQGVQNIFRRLDPQEQRNQEIAAEMQIDLLNMKRYVESRKIFIYLEGILEASKRASSIVANMLQFSRMSHQSKTNANVKDLIDQTIDLVGNDYELKKKYDFKQIKISTDYDLHQEELFCNITEIQQVILNLLKNAAHALYEKKTPEFVPSIIIRTRCSETILRIEIEDNGPGIPESIRSRVFEPFFTTKEVGVGTGLGLSVSFFIITKNHFGTIELESQTGIGTKFIIQLPLKINVTSNI
jgi:PAS domain S-box-containing protein